MRGREKVVSKVYVRGAAKMSSWGRKTIATWLRGVASDLEEDGKNWATHYYASYIVVDRAWKNDNS